MRRLNPWFVAPVAVAGVAGALIGRNVARVSCVPVTPGAACDPGGSAVGFAIVGALLAVVGVGIVMALVIVSLTEWRRSTRHDDE